MTLLKQLVHLSAQLTLSVASVYFLLSVPLTPATDAFKTDLEKSGPSGHRTSTLDIFVEAEDLPVIQDEVINQAIVLENLSTVPISYRSFIESETLENCSPWLLQIVRIGDQEVVYDGTLLDFAGFTFPPTQNYLHLAAHPQAENFEYRYSLETQTDPEELAACQFSLTTLAWPQWSPEQTSGLQDREVVHFSISPDSLTQSEEEDGPQVQLSQNEDDLLIDFAAADGIDLIKYAVLYRHVFEGEEVEEVIEGEAGKPAADEEFSLPPIFIGNCSSGILSCAAHQDVENMEVTILYKLGPDIVGSTTHDFSWQNDE